MVTQDHSRKIAHENGERKVLSKALCAPGELSLEVKRFEVRNQDVFLLCSDGFYENLPHSAIKQGMNGGNLQEGMSYMSSLILKGDANDNLTATLVAFD